MVIPFDLPKGGAVRTPYAALNCSKLDIYTRDSLKLRSDSTSAWCSFDFFKNTIIYVVTNPVLNLIKHPTNQQ